MRIAPIQPSHHYLSGTIFRMWGRDQIRARRLRKARKAVRLLEKQATSLECAEHITPQLRIWVGRCAASSGAGATGLQILKLGAYSWLTGMLVSFYRRLSGVTPQKFTDGFIQEYTTSAWNGVPVFFLSKILLLLFAMLIAVFTLGALTAGPVYAIDL